MGILGLIVAGYTLVVVTWVYYLAAMKLMRHRKQLHLVARFHGWVFVIIPGLIYDAILNLVLATIVFADPPREIVLTARLRRYKAQASGWRRRAALWICEHLLDQFDEGGHC